MIPNQFVGAGKPVSTLDRVEGILFRIMLKQRPGQPARAKLNVSSHGRCRASGNLREDLRRAGLERLNGVGGNLLAELGEFLALRGQRLELAAGVGRKEREHFGWRLHTDQLLGEV